MYPLHDHDLDRLSREAAEHFEVEPGASGWEHLEKRLDQELPQKKKRRRFLFWLFFITATTGGALTALLTYKPVTPLSHNAPGVVTPAGKPSAMQQQDGDHATFNEEIKNAPATESASTPVSSSQTKVTPNPVAGSQVPVTSSSTSPGSNNTQQPVNATAISTSPNKSNIAPVAKAGKQIKSKPAQPAPADKAPLSLNYTTITPRNTNKNAWHSTRPSRQKPRKQQRAITGGNNSALNPGSKKTTAPDQDIVVNDQPVKAEPAEVKPDASSAMQATAAPTDSTKSNTVAPVADSAKTLVKETQKKEADHKEDKNVRGLELGLIAGPDMSAVAFGPLYKAGYNVGLQVGYRFSNRWSVNTGIIYTKKFYQADSQHFHYKNSNWNWDLDKVEGNCSMWEIPVNVRYDVSFNNKRRWFVSTGLSTYLMDKEYYTLSYYTAGGYPYPVPLNSDSNSNYFFSIWNLSAGMERSLGKHFSLQAEPYLKVPLKGLGKGSIRMNSYGIYFTLKYKPGFRTKRSMNNK